MQNIETAILRTLLYADIFRFAMTAAELHRYLICSKPIAVEAIEETLRESPRLQTLLIQEKGYITLTNRYENITRRIEGEQYIQPMWDDAMRYGHWLAQIPFVRMVALTGALAVRNPVDVHDDYDYLLVTQPRRVWLARGLAIVLVRLVRLFKRELCPNYVLASDQLEQERRDLFMAREVVQMFPIYGDDIYQAMMTANNWVGVYQPNATPYPTEKSESQPIKMILEKLFGGWLGDKLEQWEYSRKRRKFAPEVHQPESSAVIDSGHVKGHFNDNGHPVMQKYQARLREYGLLEDETIELAGD
ncbi:MAG: hypothetical protein Q9P44_02705 [Anaerolineae bacterium]|nr:hypothetical protein [Anaerolineae bacterium]